MSTKKQPPQIFAAKSGSLADSAWMRAVSRYLMVSIRLGAYAASVHLLSGMDFAAGRFIPSILIRKFAYLVYGIIVYEAAAYIVRKRYKPKFARAGDVKKVYSNQLALNDKDYEYRVAAEKLIYESLLFYGFSLAFAVALCNITGVEAGWQKIGLGLLGGFVSFFNFFGVVIIAASGASVSFKAIPAYLGGFIFMTPLIAYLVFTMGYMFSG